MAQADHRAIDGSGCPVSAAGDAYLPYDHDGVYPFFARARRGSPVFYSFELGYWVVTRREDVLSVLRNPRAYSASVALEPISEFPPALLSYLSGNGFTVEPVQVNCDRPKHARIRQHAARFLNAKRYASYGPEIRRLARSDIDAMRGHGRVDLVASFTYEFPARVIFTMLGIPDIDAKQIKRWGDNRLMMIWGKLSPDQLLDAGKELNDFFQFCRSLVDDRVQDPRDDYPSQLLAIRNGDDAVLTLNEIVCLLFGLLLAGHETTTNAIGNVLLALLTDGEQWQRLVRDPSLIPNAVEEGLRYNSSVVNWRRMTLEDVEIAGERIPKGSRILVSLGSANHDEAHFTAGERFDVTRSNAGEHLAFGNGIHLCMGAALARLEIGIALEELTKAFPRMSLVPEQTIEWIRTISFRGPTRLLVDLGA